MVEGGRTFEVMEREVGADFQLLYGPTVAFELLRIDHEAGEFDSWNLFATALPKPEALTIAAGIESTF